VIDDLRVDLAGAVAVVEAAASFDWTWHVSDIERFCDHLGWDEPTPSRHDDTLMWARADLDAEDAVATFRLRGHRLDTVTLPVGDEGCGLGESGATAFDEVTAALREAFGDPTGDRISARYGPSWTFEDLVVGVAHGAAIELMLVDPLDQAHWGTGDRRVVGSATRFAEMVPELVRADFGTWSLEEVESSLPSMASGLSLRIEKEDQDVHKISVIDSMDEWPGDDVYRAVFDACQSSLGVPDLIGGGYELFAVWTGDDTTMRVSHYRRWDRTITVAVELSPTEVTQNRVADLAANWLDYLDDDCPAYDERWHLRPDVDTPLRPDIGLLTEPQWQAENWEELSRNVTKLFDSLVDGLRFHHEYVGEIGWAIGAYDELVVHGWFGAYTCAVHTVEDGEVRIRTRLLERDTVKLVTETTMAALQDRTASPRDLWCEAWTPGQPEKLVAVRFGLDGDRPDPVERELDS
jgi:hypothetical protein